MDDKDNEKKDEVETENDGGAEPAASGEKKKKKGGVKKVILITLAVVFAIILTVTVAGVAVIHHYISKIEYVDPEDTEHDVLPGNDYYFTDDVLDMLPPPTPGTGDGTAGTGTETTPPETDVVWPDMDDITSFNDDKLINIMIVGQDRRAGQGRQRSDTMILVSINPDTNEVSLISFLRDLYVQIPGGYMDNRLNTAYIWGGFRLLKDTMYQNFGVTIDGCFECDFYDFMDIIDYLGGVEIDVTKAESDHMKSFFKVDAPYGHVRLNGKQALAYARIRYIDSDFQRTDRQRRILLSLFNEFKDASVSELKSIADEILPKLATDMTVGERWALLAQLLPVVSKMKVTPYAIPFEGSYTAPWIRGMWVILPDLGMIRDKLANEYLPF